MSQVSLNNAADIIFPFERWNGDHHISVPNEVLKGEGEHYHVFAIVGGSAYKESSSRIPVDIVIPIGPVQLRLSGYIDLLSLEVDITVSVKIPFLAEITLGHFKGNLNDGIEISVGVPGVLSGTLKLYVKEKDGQKWLYLSGTLDVFGKKFKLNIRLIPIPP